MVGEVMRRVIMMERYFIPETPRVKNKSLVFLPFLISIDFASIWDLTEEFDGRSAYDLDVKVTERLSP
jgi:hypothetical protein